MCWAYHSLSRRNFYPSLVMQMSSRLFVWIVICSVVHARLTMDFRVETPSTHARYPRISPNPSHAHRSRILYPHIAPPIPYTYILHILLISLFCP